MHKEFENQVPMQATYCLSQKLLFSTRIPKELDKEVLLYLFILQNSILNLMLKVGKHKKGIILTR